MKITHNHLLHLPVYTRSNEWLGRIMRFTLDCDKQLVVEYTVAPFPYIHSLAPGRTIPRTAVVSITTERMVVEDSMARATEPSVLARPISTVPAAEG